MAEESRALIALKMIRGVGDSIVRALLQHFGSAVEALAATAGQLAEAAGVGRETAQRITSDREAALQRAEREQDFAQKHDIRIYTLPDETYPTRLRACPSTRRAVIARPYSVQRRVPTMLTMCAALRQSAPR